LYLKRTAGFLSTAIHRPEREADHSPLYNAKVDSAFRFTSTPPYPFMFLCLDTDISCVLWPHKINRWTDRFALYLSIWSTFVLFQ